MELNTVYFYSSNLFISKDFFQNVLGLALISESDSFVSFDLGQKVTLGIKLASSDRDKTPGQQSIGFSTSDIQKLYADYKKLKLTFIKDLTQNSWGSEFAISDPDGNKITILN